MPVVTVELGEFSRQAAEQYLTESRATAGLDAGERTKIILEFGRKTVDVESLREEIRLSEEMAKKLGAEVGSLQVELVTQERITLIEKAVVPGKEK